MQHSLFINSGHETNWNFELRSAHKESRQLFHPAGQIGNRCNKWKSITEIELKKGQETRTLIKRKITMNNAPRRGVGGSETSEKWQPSATARISLLFFRFHLFFSVFFFIVFLHFFRLKKNYLRILNIVFLTKNIVQISCVTFIFELPISRCKKYRGFETCAKFNFFF